MKFQIKPDLNRFDNHALGFDEKYLFVNRVYCFIDNTHEETMLRGEYVSFGVFSEKSLYIFEFYYSLHNDEYAKFLLLLEESGAIYDETGVMKKKEFCKVFYELHGRDYDENCLPWLK